MTPTVTDIDHTLQPRGSTKRSTSTIWGSTFCIKLALNYNWFGMNSRSFLEKNFYYPNTTLMSYIAVFIVPDFLIVTTRKYKGSVLSISVGSKPEPRHSSSYSNLKLLHIQSLPCFQRRMRLQSTRNKLLSPLKTCSSTLRLAIHLLSILTG